MDDDLGPLDTAEDVVPAEGRPKMPIVDEVPACDSAAAVHCARRRQGRMFWRELRECGFLSVPMGKDAGAAFLDHGHGVTDIVKLLRDADTPTARTTRL